MADCRLMQGCTYFTHTLGNVPEPIIEGYRHRFCRGDHLACARLAVAASVGADKVPTQLGPHESGIAAKLIRSYGGELPHSLMA